MSASLHRNQQQERITSMNFGLVHGMKQAKGSDNKHQNLSTATIAMHVIQNHRLIINIRCKIKVYIYICTFIWHLSHYNNVLN